MAPKQFFTAKQIQEMGIELLHSYTDAGNHFATDTKGLEVLKELEGDEDKQKMIQEAILKLAQIKQINKLKGSSSKYGTRFTPSPKRNRKAKTKY